MAEFKSHCTHNSWTQGLLNSRLLNPRIYECKIFESKDHRIQDCWINWMLNSRLFNLSVVEPEGHWVRGLLNHLNQLLKTKNCLIQFHLNPLLITKNRLIQNHWIQESLNQGFQIWAIEYHVIEFKGCWIQGCWVCTWQQGS